MSCIRKLKIEKTSLEEKVENYHKLWQDTINNMYEQELPGQKNRYIVELTNEDEKFCKNVYDKFNVGGELFSNYEDKINFILCMLVMPQLLAIGEFYERAYNEHITKAKSILSVVQNNNSNFALE